MRGECTPQVVAHTVCRIPPRRDAIKYFRSNLRAPSVPLQGPESQYIGAHMVLQAVIGTIRGRGELAIECRRRDLLKAGALEKGIILEKDVSLEKGMKR